VRTGLVLAVGLLLLACRTPAPAYAPLPVDDPRAELLLHHWHQSVMGREGLRAVARLSVDGTGRNPTRLRVRQNLWLRRPTSLRVEIQGPLRTALGVLVTDGLQYSVNAADGTREMGPVHDALLHEVAYLALTPAEAVDVILGFPALTDGLKPGRSYAGSDGNIRLDLVDRSGKPVRQLEFDTEGHLARVESGDLAEAGHVVEFSDYALIDDAPFAHRVAIESPSSRAILVLSVVELNPALPPNTFSVDALLRGEGE
jgi:hypothetical protein